MLSIRAASVADASLLSQLGPELFVQALGRQNTAEDMRLYLAGAFSVNQWRTELAEPTRRTWIAEDASNVPIGYAVLSLAAAPSFLGAVRAAEIARLYADEHWHGRGVGAALMHACLEQARAWGSDVVWLGVWTANSRAIAFYEKHGFQVVGAQEFQLGTDTQHDHVMARRLD